MIDIYSKDKIQIPMPWQPLFPEEMVQEAMKKSTQAKLNPSASYFSYHRTHTAIYKEAPRIRYQVAVPIEPETIGERWRTNLFRCDCERGRKHLPCLHEAALLWQVEKKSPAGVFTAEESLHDYVHRIKLLSSRERLIQEEEKQKAFDPKLFPALDFFKQRKERSGPLLYDIRSALSAYQTDAYSCAMAREILKAEQSYVFSAHEKQERDGRRSLSVNLNLIDPVDDCRFTAASAVLTADHLTLTARAGFRNASGSTLQSLENTLRPYQSYGFKWIKTLEGAGFGGILADEMGLGKTLQMISVLSSSYLNIASSAATPAAPITGGASAFQKLEAHWTDRQIYIISYDLLKRNLARLNDKTFFYVILDEAQYIKNAGAAAAKSVKTLKASHRFALTGTPIENRLSEMWSIFDFLMPGFLYGRKEFEKKWEVPITKSHDADASTQLRKMTSPFILRRKKEEVLKDLPAKLEEVRYVQIEGEQQKLYDAQVLRLKNALGEWEIPGQKMRVFAELTRIRQICCDPSLLNEGAVPIFLISLKAGGTGLNLTGADVVIHYDPWWNVAAQNQATDRAHRIGQTRQVTVYRLIIKDTIEERILELQNTKRDLAESILEGDSTSLPSLSHEELLELIGG